MKSIVPYASLLILSAIVFGPTLSHEFVWDDHEQVRDNPIIRSWSSLDDVWHKDILELSRAGGEHHSNYYRPLFYTQYVLYYKAFGLNAALWHAMAIVHHAFAACAALLFLRVIGFAPAIAWMAGALFVVHPAHGESVSWVAAAFNDPPAATMILLGLSAHAAWRRRGKRRRLALGALAYAAALCLKESALSMLLLVPLVDWYIGRAQAPPAGSDAGASPSGLRRRAFFLGFLPYLGVTIVYFAARWLALGSAFGVYEAAGSKPVSELVWTLPMLAVFYVRLLLWPFGLAPTYPLRYVPGAADVRFWGALLAVAAIVALVARLTRRRPALRFGALWVVCCIWPVFNIRSFLPAYLAHQRYLYLAALGLCVVMAWLLVERIRARRVRYALLGGIVALWSVTDLYHDRYWATDRALWARVCEVDPHNPAGFDWLGADARAAGRLDEAERLWLASIEGDPTSPIAYRNLAILHHLSLEQPAAALPWYEKALPLFEAREPRYHAEYLECRVNYGVCLAALGRTDDALRTFLAAAETPPYPTDAAGNAALLLVQRGRMEDAERILMISRDRNPEAAAAFVNLAQLYLATGRPHEAVRAARAAASLAPGTKSIENLVSRAEAASR